MRQQAHLGRWILDRLGPEQVISANLADNSLILFYAEGQPGEVFSVSDCELGRGSPSLDSRTADLVLVWNSEPQPRPISATLEGHLKTQFGYCRVPAADMPLDCDRAALFVRTGKSWKR
jgi:hypothetical protein